MQLDGFAAEPGTVPSREEFRATGGSVYFLRRQDILTGSERVRIELRDPDSGLVTGVVQLRPGLDYDFDYFQGRVLLSEPLTVDRRRQQPARAQRRRGRRRGLARGPVRVHAGLRGDEHDRRGRSGSLLVRRLR